MKGLIKADYYMMKADIRSNLTILGFFALLSVFLKSPMYIMTMQSVVAILFLFSMLTMDENGKDAYYQQLPFDKKELVKEKYVRGFVFLLPFIFVSQVVGLVITLSLIHI